jgi:hypothetical protein
MQTADIQRPAAAAHINGWHSYRRANCFSLNEGFLHFGHGNSGRLLGLRLDGDKVEESHMERM